MQQACAWAAAVKVSRGLEELSPLGSAVALPPRVVCRRAEGAYALQLTLSALRFLMASQPEDGCSRYVSYEAVMDCIQRCSDRLVQNAALSLLSLLAAAMPQQHLTRLTEVPTKPSVVVTCACSLQRCFLGHGTELRSSIFSDPAEVVHR